MNLKIKGVINNLLSVGVSVDVDETGGRYDVVLTSNPKTKEYTIAITNSFISMETKYPLNCHYKLVERGMSSADAKAVEEILAKLLYPRLQSFFKEV